MLIDQFIPHYEFSERHRKVIDAPPEEVRSAVAAWRPEDSTLWSWLVRLRGLGKPAGSLREWAEAAGFLCLADTPDEVVHGIIGRFWAIRERQALVRPKTIDEFRSFSDPRYAVGAMNITVRPRRDGRTRLATETRVHALGPESRRRFRLYWLVIRPFSGLLRRSMLNGMASMATHRATSSQPVKGS
jgi:hypothetical protein